MKFSLSRLAFYWNCDMLMTNINDGFVPANLRDLLTDAAWPGKQGCFGFFKDLRTFFYCQEYNRHIPLNRYEIERGNGNE